MNKNTIILTLSHLIRIYSSCEGRRGEEGRGRRTRRFELRDVAATELEQRDSLKVSSQSPYLLPSEGHGEPRIK